MRSAGPEYRFYDLAFGVVGIALWLWVSMLWKDRALILLNGVSLFMLMTALFKDML
jgi:ABC-type siderophore export system fused ATPase/permease subunit